MKKIKLMGLIVLAALLIIGTTVVLAQENDPPVERKFPESASAEPLPYPDPGDEIRVYPLGETDLERSGEDAAARSHEFGSFAIMEPQAPPEPRSLSEPGALNLDTAPFELADQDSQDWVGMPIKEDVSSGD